LSSPFSAHPIVSERVRRTSWRHWIRWLAAPKSRQGRSRWSKWTKPSRRIAPHRCCVHRTHVYKGADPCPIAGSGDQRPALAGHDHRQAIRTPRTQARDPWCSCSPARRERPSRCLRELRRRLFRVRLASSSRPARPSDGTTPSPQMRFTSAGGGRQRQAHSFAGVLKVDASRCRRLPHRPALVAFGDADGWLGLHESGRPRRHRNAPLPPEHGGPMFRMRCSRRRRRLARSNTRGARQDPPRPYRRRPPRRPVPGPPRPYQQVCAGRPGLST